MTRSPLWLGALLIGTALHAQAPLTGVAPASAAEQLAYEAALREQVDTARARMLSAELSSEPHVAGTPRQRWSAFWVDSMMRSWGLETQVDSYLVYIPHPQDLRVERVSPDPLQLRTSEPSLQNDPGTAGYIFPQFNAYTGNGEVTAEIVYVNYGLIEDYEVLEEAGVSVEGKIAVARYGRSYRGIKAREAERHGAVGLLMYSDPIDDGYTRGDVYPEGPYRPEVGVQRGSIKNSRGDPSTPEYASTFDAPRVPADEMEGVARIPVAPISYSAAAELLRDLRGTDLPQQSWQGGLPFRYHLGPGPVQARIVVRTDSEDRAYRTIYNTLGFVRGTEHPDEWVIVGAHRDAWGPGAIDNVSGTVSVLESARAFGELARTGHRPARTVVFATWDAEEWGLIGSTEYVERLPEQLAASVVAYVNQDASASGPRFGASASGELKEVVREVSRSVPDPFSDWNLFDTWAEQTSTPEGERIGLGDLGGGSDFAGFYNHLGIGAINFGFGGTGGGVYHSAYDTHYWMSTFGDPQFLAHAGAAQVSVSLLARLANADIHPYDYQELTLQLGELVDGLEGRFSEVGWEISLDPVRDELAELGIAARQLATNRGETLESDPDFDFTEINGILRRASKALTRESGLRGREWYKGLIFAADRDNGYANIALPGIVEAVRDDDYEWAQHEVADLASRVENLKDQLVLAVRALYRARE